MFGFALILVAFAAFLVGISLLNFEMEKDEAVKRMEDWRASGIVVVFQRKNETKREACYRLRCQGGVVIELDGTPHEYAPCVEYGK